MRSYVLLLVSLLALFPSRRCFAATAEAGQPRLIPRLSLSRTAIVFAHAGDLWIVPRSGGTARQLTRGLEDDGGPMFSPDGSQVSFSRTVRGDADVYVVSSAGGEPKRLTFHPASEVARGWTPDGSKVVFAASTLLPWQANLFTLPAAGGPSVRLPIARALTGVHLPDGRFVFAPRDVFGGYPTTWRGYRGGTTGILMVTDLRGSNFRSLSDGAVNDRFPVVAGGTLLIASDRVGGILNVFALNPDTGAARPITRFGDVGIDALAGGPDGRAAFVRNGRIFLLDPRTGAVQPLAVTVNPDRGQMLPRKVKAADHVAGTAVSRDGQAAFAARGEILLLHPSEAARQLSASSGTAEDEPSFSPDGRRLAFVSARQDGDRLVLLDLPSGGKKEVALPAGRAGWQNLRWSPDGARIALEDFRSGLWVATLAQGEIRQIDQGRHLNDDTLEAAWSPDSRWIAYSRHLPNHNRAVFLREVSAVRSRRLTDGGGDARAPAFDAGGRSLYFLGGGSAAVGEAFGMASEIHRPLVVRHVFAGALDPREAEPEVAFNASLRRLAVEPRDYGRLVAMAEGGLLASAAEWPSTPGAGEPKTALYRINPLSGDSAKVAGGLDSFAISPEGGLALVQAGDERSVIPAGEGGVAARPVSLMGVEIAVEPKQEWRQIYRAAWRAMRDAFYDPAHHGQDVQQLERRYAAYLPSITRRADLTALLQLSLGNVSVSHIAVSGGDLGAVAERPPTSGLLGADFAVGGDRHRFTRIHKGDAYLGATSPLQLPGSIVNEGEYLLAVNGKEARADRDVHEHLLGTAGKPTRLTVGPSPTGDGARDVTVTPIASEYALREASWIERNRRQVTERSGGRIGYVYITDYETDGLAGFIRQWTAASDKGAVLLDQRFNPGGWAADFVLDMVRRKPLSYYAFRDADPLPFPVISNAGPVALLINHANGSAADTFPWLFKRAQVGPVVGVTTGGAGVGHVYRTDFVDGGGVSLPLRAFFNPQGTWDIENQGVSPDIRIEEDQAALLRGRDVQLDAAVDVLLEGSKSSAQRMPKRPSPTIYPTERKSSIQPERR